ncbi:MAG: hypothetical protein KY464_14365 [Gemmatimonadetes bacterium]|nr:hypothetical protein [Gemmatimonadota bacterium]
MESPAPRGNRPSDPVRQQLVEIRRGLLRLHKALIDSERTAFEARSGATSNGQFLQLLLQDPFFVWLRPFSGLIAQMDEALAAAEGVSEDAAGAFVAQVRALIATTEENSGSETRYDVVRSRDPDVLFAHVELARRVGPAANI